MKQADNRMGTASRQATEGVRRCPTTQSCPEDHGFDAVIVKRADTSKCPGSCQSSERQQTVCATELKCLQRSPQGDRAARKGIVDLLPGAEKRSSAARVFDGT